MDNKEQEKDISSAFFDKDNDPDNYKILAQKLKNIRENIYLLEKNFLNKET